MKSKIVITLLILIIILCVTSCTAITKPMQNGEIKTDSNIEDVESTEKIIDSENNKYDTIKNTYDSLDKIGGRLIGTDENYLFAKELKMYMEENFKNTEIFVQPYSISLTEKYEVTISSGNDNITFNNEDSICKYINKSKINETDVILTDSLNNLNEQSEYIFFTNDESLIESSKKLDNICLSLLIVDKIYLGQNAIKVKTDMPTIMNIDGITAEKLSDFVNKRIKLNVNLQNEEIELENIYAIIKGKESKNAIVITSHYDTTTAKGENYSKGAIDNGSGISLNLDLLKKFYNSNTNLNYDIVFSFVNSEEGFLLKTTSGGMQISNLMSQQYENVLNINLDCIGEKDIEVLSYGFDGDINKDMLNDIIASEANDFISLEKVDYYTSDNLNFNNSLYFYNFDYHGDNRAIHTENDKIDKIDIDKLEKISNILYEVIKQILQIDASSLFI